MDVTNLDPPEFVKLLQSELQRDLAEPELQSEPQRDLAEPERPSSEISLTLRGLKFI